MVSFSEIQDAYNAVKSVIAGLLLRVVPGSDYTTKGSELSYQEFDGNVIKEGDTIKSLAEQGLALLPHVEQAEKLALLNGTENEITGDITVKYPDDVGGDYVKTDSSQTTITVQEGNHVTGGGVVKKLPKFFSVETFPGAGDISLASHGSNTITAVFRHNDVVVETISGEPTEGHSIALYIFKRRANTNDTYDIFLKGGLAGTGAINTPNFEVNPAAEYIGSSFFQVSLTPDRNCTVYWGNYAEASATPSAADLKSGAGTGFISNGNVAASESDEKIYLSEGSLQRLTAYDHFVMLETASGVQSTIFKLDVTTDEIKIDPANSASHVPETDDNLEDSLNMPFDTSNMPIYSKLGVWAMGTGGAAKEPFLSCTFGPVSMTKVFEFDFDSGDARCLQLYMLDEASTPKGSHQITVGEDLDTVPVARVMGVFIIESVEQALIPQLIVGNSDSSRDEIRLSRAFGESSNNLSLASLVGNFLAVSIFLSTGDTPFSSDGSTVESVDDPDRAALVSTKEGEDEVIGFTVSSTTTGNLEHLVFAEQEKT